MWVFVRLSGVINVLKQKLLCALSALIVLVFFGVFSIAANAEKRLDLYTDTQLVLDQSLGLRQQAVTASLSMIFVRVTGKLEIIDEPAVKQALSRSSTYLSQYRYSTTDEVITIAGATRPAQLLWLQFSATAIQRVLQDAGLSVWPDLRPEILLWVASDSAKRQLLSAQTAEVNTFKRIGATRGLPIAMPLLDLADRRALSSTRLWARDEAAIKQASVRYGADGVLAGRLVSLSADAWRGDFILMYGGRSYYFSAEDDTTTIVIQRIMNQVIDVLANANAIIVSDAAVTPSIVIVVDNVSDFDAYTDVLDALKKVSSISHVMIQQVMNNHLILELRYQGSVDKLLAVLSSLPEWKTIAVSEFIIAHPPSPKTTPENNPGDIVTTSQPALVEPALPNANASPVEVVPASQKPAPSIRAAFVWRSVGAQ